MKTYHEILNDVIEEYHRYQLPTQTSPEERAAKEYAKQWLDRAQAEIPDVTSWAYRNIIRFKKEIDEQ